MLYVRYVHPTMAIPMLKRHTHPTAIEEVTSGLICLGLAVTRDCAVREAEDTVGSRSQATAGEDSRLSTLQSACVSDIATVTCSYDL
jgi:hypothetical protein